MSEGYHETRFSGSRGFLTSEAGVRNGSILVEVFGEHGVRGLRYIGNGEYDD